MTIELLVAFREAPRATTLAMAIAVADGSIAAQATDVASTGVKASLGRPDVLLLEHTHDEAHHVWQAMSRVMQVSAGTRVLLLCDGWRHDSITGFVLRGAAGCVLSTHEPSLYAKAVRTVHAGETWFGRTDLLRALRGQLNAAGLVSADVSKEQRLTGREQEILELIGNAMSNKEIARRLKISEHTVKTHLHRIYVKLEKSGRYKAFLSKRPGMAGRRSVSPAGEHSGLAGNQAIEAVEV